MNWKAKTILFSSFLLQFTSTEKLAFYAFAGSAGVEIAQFIKNNEKSYIIPITNFVVDFDDTLSKGRLFQTMHAFVSMQLLILDNTLVQVSLSRT